MQRGKFISFEGSEGGGKSTQISVLEEFLIDHGVEVISTREPGGTPIAEKIRDLLLDNDNTGLLSDTELLLVFAARSQHIQELIIPALTAGKWVISDRFTDASFAYQGYGRKIPLARIEALQQWVQQTPQGLLTPDLTFLFDLPVEAGLQRAKKRAAADRFESEQRAFFESVRQGYLQLALQEPERFEVIDAMQPIAGVSEQVLRKVSQWLPIT